VSEYSYLNLSKYHSLFNNYTKEAGIITVGHPTSSCLLLIAYKGEKKEWDCHKRNNFEKIKNKNKNKNKK